MFVGWCVWFSGHSHQFWLVWLVSRVILCGKASKISLRSCSLWSQMTHSSFSLCNLQYWEAGVLCSSHLRVILIIIMVFVKDISLACFFNKWSLFLWFGCWGSGRICVPKGHPDCLPWGLELCPCSPAACGLAAFLFITSIVGVTESSSVWAKHS